MFLDLHTYNWFIRPGQTDMRKRSNSLSMLVHNEMNLSLFEKNIFVFCGGNKKVIRAIVWDRNGWWELSKLFCFRNNFDNIQHPEPSQ
jgi:transposase